jgi:ribonuclease R
VFLQPDKESFTKAGESFRKVLEDIREIEDAQIREMLFLRILRTVPQAFYSADNIFHFGLNSTNYCHFTSPIRRYPDILVHRTLKASLAEEGKGGQVDWEAPAYEEIVDLMDHINEMTGDADFWEREMIDVALATRIEMDPGSRNGIRKGMITSITPSSCYVLTNDGVTEGRIPIRTMSRFGLVTDESESLIHTVLEGDALKEQRFMRLVSKGEDKAVFHKLGDRIGCSVHSTSIASGNVELSYTDGG